MSSAWDKMSIQTKSDVIRVFLLHDHGGVWADATVCMTQRLPRLFHENVDFNTFIRYRQSSPDKYNTLGIGKSVIL